MIVRPATRRLPAAARSGFTLLEVLVVVAILVILASVATFAVVSHLSGAREDEAALKAQNIQKAALAYTTKAGQFPDSLEVLIMRDPNTGTLPMLEGGIATITDPWQQPYQFKVIEDATGTPRFVVYTFTPEGKEISWPRN
jgi:general secretion pathway protein G